MRKSLPLSWWGNSNRMPDPPRRKKTEAVRIVGASEPPEKRSKSARTVNGLPHSKRIGTIKDSALAYKRKSVATVGPIVWKKRFREKKTTTHRKEEHATTHLIKNKNLSRTTHTGTPRGGKGKVDATGALKLLLAVFRSKE